jgi:hypothetical protein
MENATKPVNAQQLLDREGFIVWCSPDPLKLGQVVEEPYEDAVAPQGSLLVITESISYKDALAWAVRCGLPIDLTVRAKYKYFYKAIAE